MVGVPKDLKMRADFVVCVGVEAVQKVECRVRAWHRFPRDERLELVDHTVYPTVLTYDARLFFNSMIKGYKLCNNLRPEGR